VALYVIGKTSSGVAVAIQRLMDLDLSTLVQMMIVVVIVAAASDVGVIGCARLAAQAITRLNYQLLCGGVLLFLLSGME
jgi:TctA family transporter